MERRFDMSDFEQSLKDHADQFRMTPSKRVWNGIYNNLHPGSKWPSITIAILFLFTLITIGRFNNSTVHFNNPSNNDLESSKNTLESKSKTQGEHSVAIQKNNQNDLSKAEVNILKNNPSANEIVPQNKVSTNSSSAIVLPLPPFSKKQNGSRPVAEGKQAKIISLHSEAKSLPENISESKPELADLAFSPAETQIPGIIVVNPNEIPENSFHAKYIRQAEMFRKELSIPVSFLNFPISPNEPFYLTAFALNEGKQITDASFNQPENSLRENKNLKKKKNKPEWTFYINPLISTVSKKSIQPLGNNSSVVVLSNQSPFNLLRKPRLGFEVGSEMSFKIDKKIKFITGFNLSYSGYNNLSNLVHPTYASLSLRNAKGVPYTKNYITHYGNGQSPGHISLINYNIDASIPLGIQFNIFENGKIGIDFATLLEPTVMLKNDAYIISSDGRYYVNDPKLVRRTNLDGHFGTYITFKSKKIKWHIGPDFRYQIFSTYKNIYPAKEHLVDYGIRIGISK